MKRACDDCVYFATITILDHRSVSWCALGMLRIRGRGFRTCPHRDH
ncbi:MAG: hypothetical protein K2L00_10360 [Muribaculaceae bacterium]|nr:hypothetical protein [Muribaculaceae bacterium]